MYFLPLLKVVQKMSKAKRKICVVTGTRAEYGLLYWLLHEIKSDPDLDLQIIATGMHLSPEFGLTYRVIEEDGFKIDYKVEMLLSSDTPIGIAKSMGLGVIGFADAYSQLKPDLVVLLGDRFELLSAAQAAMVAKLPIAHLHGGEATEGLIDEPIRHAITKMSQLHFVSAEPYRRRVIQLGENPERVFHFGSPGLDNIHRLKLLDKAELQEALNFQLGKTNFLITYHPVTLSVDSALKGMNALLSALRYFPEVKVIFTKPNSDTDGRIIVQLIDEYVEKNPKRAASFTSLGQLNYLSAIKHIDVVIGNSSSGLYEVPAFKKPTVNLGERQRGRLQSDTVINSVEQTDCIVEAIKYALSKEFQATLNKAYTPYYSDGNVSLKIKDQIKSVDLNDIIMKKFHDLVV